MRKTIVTITNVHEYKKTDCRQPVENDVVWSLVLVISLQKFSNKSYYYLFKNEQEGIFRFKKGLFWSKILDIKFSRVFIRYKDTS